MKDKKLLRAYLCAFAVVIACLFFNEPVYAAGDTLKIAYKTNSPYYVYETEDGESAGLYIDLMNAIAEEMDLKHVEYYPMPDMKACIEALESGKAEAILGFPVYYDGDTSNILISSEINTINLSMMAKAENAEKIRNGKRNQYTAIFEHNVNNYMMVSNMNAGIYYVAGSQRAVLDALLEGQADVMVCDKDCVSWIMKSQGLEEELAVIRSNVGTVGYSVAVQKGNDSLLRAVNEGIFRIRMTGKYEEIAGNWIEKEQVIDIQKYMRIAAAAAAVFLAVVGTYLFFNRRVRIFLEKRVMEMTAELEKTIQNLKQERNLRNQIIEYDPSIIVLCDKDENVVLMNAAARRIAEAFREDVEGKPLKELNVIGKMVDAVREQEQCPELCTVDHVLFVYPKDQRYKRKYRCSIAETNIGEMGMGYLIRFSDVTEEEKQKQELIESEKSAAVLRLVAGIAHEIKNPLTGIQNFADLIKTEKDNEQFWVYFEQYVPSEISRISRLIESLLNYARPEKGKKERTEVAGLVEESLYLMNTAVSNAGIELHVSAADELFIYAGRDQMKQILINLVLNSLEAVVKRKQQERIEECPYGISVTAYEKNSYVYIEISDEGIGMSEEDIQNCMDPFYTTKEFGTGLGLAVSRQFVQENGGTIHIESAEGAGTTIRLRFRSEKHEQTDFDH